MTFDHDTNTCYTTVILCSLFENKVRLDRFRNGIPSCVVAFVLPCKTFFSFSIYISSSRGGSVQTAGWNGVGKSIRVKGSLIDVQRVSLCFRVCSCWCWINRVAGVADDVCWIWGGGDYKCLQIITRILLCSSIAMRKEKHWAQLCIVQKLSKIIKIYFY